MELYEMELEKAQAILRSQGRQREDFSFEMAYQPPDPDGAGMFTVRYDVTVTNRKTGKTLGAVGGIGLDWVGAFEAALEEGRFD